MPDGPNVLVVMADQLRGQAMGCAGDPNVETPNLDRLAADGTRFENAYTTCPVCVPARATMMTGEYAHSSHIPSIGWELPAERRTLADEFAGAGYQTSWIGKWHLSDGIHNPQHATSVEGTEVAPVPPDLQGGFEHWRGFEFRNGPFDTYYFADDDPTPYPIEGYQTDGLTDLALEFVEERDSDRPFFCTLSVEPPHPPYEAPEEYENRLADRDLDLRPNVDLDGGGDSFWAVDPDAFDSQVRSYYAMIENLDANVGRLLDSLDATGLREETVVVFLSDHGDLMGSHGLMQKHWPYEESVRIPLVVSHPDDADNEDDRDSHGGRVISEPTCTEDWYPTLCGLGGVDPGPTPGVDLSALVTGVETGLDRSGVLLELYGEFRSAGDTNFEFYGEPWRAFVTEDHKYVVKDGEPWLLFDLAHDPYEQENLIGDPDAESVGRELHGLLRERLTETDDDYVLAPAFGHPGLHRSPSVEE